MKLPIPLFCCLTAVAFAQDYSSHSGWSFSDTMETATDIVVADILAGSAADDGSQVRVNASVRIVRVLKGDILPGADLFFQWDYKPAPFEGPKTTSQVPVGLRGLWFLRKAGDNAFEPLQGAYLQDFLGSRVLKLPETAPGGVLAWAAGQPVQAKIAREVAWAMDDIAANHADALAPRKPGPPAPRAVASWMQNRMRFESLTMLLGQLNKQDTKDVYLYLSGSSNEHLKITGLGGRLSGGDTDALFELEKELPALNSSEAINRLSVHFMSVDVRNNLPAAHALARIALSEVSLPGVDGSAARALAATHRLEFLPYLITMLDSPDAFARGSALGAFCLLLGPDEGRPQTLWAPEMRNYCPNRSPMNNPEEEERDVQFWKQWWDSKREVIRKVAELPVVGRPARYNTTSPQPKFVEVPMEIRFSSLINITARPDHYHFSTGAIVQDPGTPGPRDPVTGMLSDADREAFHNVMDAVTARLKEHDKQASDVVNAARLRGAMPEKETLGKLWEDRVTSLKWGLQELQNKLSPEGWVAVHKFLSGMGIHAAGMAVPR